MEMFMLSIVQDGYFNGFYFWLDLVCTISMIADIHFLFDKLTNVEGIDLENFDPSSPSSIAMVAAASRIGSRAGRITKFIRLVRLIRIVKFFKITQFTRD